MGLVVSRKIEESVLIGDEIEIKVIRLSNKKVRIKIDAPDDVRIVRKEIAKDAKQEETAVTKTPNPTDQPDDGSSGVGSASSQGQATSNPVAQSGSA